MMSSPAPEPAAGGWTGTAVTVFWLPLGAGGHSIARNGRVFEAVAARWQGRERRDLYHAALEVAVDGGRAVIEMTPAWMGPPGERGVVCEGPVGLRVLGRSRYFRYEVRRWTDGVIGDVGSATLATVAGRDPAQARRLLDLVPSVPPLTWGRDELGAGDMWNSNSVVSWLLAGSGHDVDAVGPPPHGRAPGWLAGLVAARRR